MATTFHSFSELPAELRARIWEFAVRGQSCEPYTQDNRRIELHNYDPCAGTVSVKNTIQYPVLFAVNREARYETAKLKGCDWIPIYASYHGRDGVSDYKTFSICINFSEDSIHLSEPFLAAGQQEAWTSKTETPEQYHLNVFSQLFDANTITKIEHLSLWILPPDDHRRLEDIAWWRGEGLEMLCLGNLRSVQLFASETQKAHARWAALIVEDHLQYHWVTNGWKTSRPHVTTKVG